MKSSRHLHRLLTLAVAAVLVGAAGCGSGSTGRNPVQGSVRYAGQPVDNGGIAFIPEGEDADQRTRATGPIRDGSYALDEQRGPLPGKYRVQITWRKKTGNQVPGEGGRLRDETEQAIPAKYNTESELIVEVKPGPNTIPFDLTE